MSLDDSEIKFKFKLKICLTKHGLSTIVVFDIAINKI